MRILKAEVEKGSVRTVFGHGLDGPKALGNSVQKERDGGCRGALRFRPLAYHEIKRSPTKQFVQIPAVGRKGIGLIFPIQSLDISIEVAFTGGFYGMVWQHKRTSRRRREPWEEFSFLFNSLKTLITLESG